MEKKGKGEMEKKGKGEMEKGKKLNGKRKV